MSAREMECSDRVMMVGGGNGEDEFKKEGSA
jgi:hypothetical protein